MKFYITGLYRTAQFNDRTLPPIEVEASDRLDALSRTGCTVWTEEEWVNSTPHLYGMSEEETMMIHARPETAQGALPCGKMAWAWSTNLKDVQCVDCRANQSGTEEK